MNPEHKEQPIEFHDLIDAAAHLILSAKNGIVLTGAGISTPSGIPDFRTPGSGVWSRFNPMEVASLSAFRSQPEKFFAWLHPLAKKMFEALPNPAHYALAFLEKAGYLQAVITQNIDGLHQRAGSEQVLEVHGSMETLTCIGCYRKFPAVKYISKYIDLEIPPRCPDCDQILKPDVILYEEQLPKVTWLKAQKACRDCSVIIVVGSSLEVTPSATLPLRALENNAKLIIINQGQTYLDSQADVRIEGDVAEVLPLISQAVLDD
jgi:NAD-dependent deacetylase